MELRRIDILFLRCSIFVIFLKCTVLCSEPYEGDGVLPNSNPVNSTEAFKNIKCETNSSRFVNINFTFIFLLTNESVQFNLTTVDGYSVLHKVSENSRAVEELFLLGTSYENEAVTRIMGKKSVVLSQSGNDSIRAEYNIKDKRVVTERDETDGNSTCSTIVYGNVTGLRLIIDQSVDPDGRDQLELTPLHWAAMLGDKHVIQKLLKMGADVNVQWSRELATPLHFAAVRGDKEIVKFFIDSGADIDAEDIEEMSVVDTAIYSNQSEIVRLLIDLGANLSVANQLGRTSLHIAAQRGNLDILKTLIGHGMDVNAKDVTGRTPLNEAIEYYERDTVHLLIENGANVNFPELNKLYGEKKIRDLLGSHMPIVD